MRSTAFVSLICALLGGVATGFLGGAGPAAAQSPIALNVAPPELVSGSWLNTPQSAPITLASRRGQVTILHFWTFG
jgi:hypothetical protein